MQHTSVEKGSEYSSTGGHVDVGETPLTSIIREIKEELGIDVDSGELEYLGFLLYDKPIRFMYYLKKDIDIKALSEELSTGIYIINGKKCWVK